LQSREIPAPQFAREWLEARRRASTERVREPLSTTFDQIFSCLEDYSIDPEFAEPGDLADEEVVTCIERLWRRISEQ
jgi:hypothetical protein